MTLISQTTFNHRHAHRYAGHSAPEGALQTYTAEDTRKMQDYLIKHWVVPALGKKAKANSPAIYNPATEAAQQAILYVLTRPMTAQEIVDRIPSMTRRSVSQHCANMYERGLVDRERIESFGFWIYMPRREQTTSERLRDAIKEGGV